MLPPSSRHSPRPTSLGFSTIAENIERRLVSSFATAVHARTIYAVTSDIDRRVSGFFRPLLPNRVQILLEVAEAVRQEETLPEVAVVVRIGAPKNICIEGEAVKQEETLAEVAVVVRTRAAIIPLSRVRLIWWFPWACRKKPLYQGRGGAELTEEYV